MPSAPYLSEPSIHIKLAHFRGNQSRFRLQQHTGEGTLAGFRRQSYVNKHSNLVACYKSVADISPADEEGQSKMRQFVHKRADNGKWEGRNSRNAGLLVQTG